MDLSKIIDADSAAATEAEIDGTLAKIAAAQETVHARDGRFGQWLPTHAVPPDGKASAADRLDAKLEDRPSMESWAQVDPVKTHYRAAYSVDEYAGPYGKGYLLHAEILVDGRRYRRTVNVGPEEHLASEWGEVLETSR